MTFAKTERDQFSKDFFEKYPEKKPQMGVPLGSIDVDETNEAARKKFLAWEKLTSEEV